jgi:hypothetical protein
MTEKAPPLVGRTGRSSRSGRASPGCNGGGERGGRAGREFDQPFRRSARLSAHRSRRKTKAPHATSSSGASIVSMTLLPSKWHSIAQVMHRTMTRTHQSLRTRSSSLSSGSICGPVKEPRRSGAVRDIGSDRSAAPELCDHRIRRHPRYTRPYDAAVRFRHLGQTKKPRARRGQSYAFKEPGTPRVISVSHRDAIAGFRRRPQKRKSPAGGDGAV